MNEYGEVVIGNGDGVPEKIVYIPEPEDLKDITVIGWHSELGENWNGDWGKCPDCGKECLYIEGKPTVIHKGKVE